MKSIVLVALFATAALAAPQAPEPIPIVSQDSQTNADGSYQYSFESGNGIKVEQKGDLKKVGDVDALEVQGKFEYPSENGNIQLTYTADENGFQPQGDHLPTAPPVPEAIARSLAYLATAPPQADSQ